MKTGEGPCQTDDVPLTERVIELALFGPFDVGSRLLGEVPAVIDRAQRELVTARFIGKLAVDQGVRELRRRVERVAAVAPSANVVGAVADERLAAVAEHEATSPAPERDAATASSASDELALPDYDQLPASHIVAKLSGLEPSERDAIERYERAHRSRRTVLGKLEQLRAR